MLEFELTAEQRQKLCASINAYSADLFVRLESGGGTKPECSYDELWLEAYMIWPSATGFIKVKMTDEQVVEMASQIQSNLQEVLSRVSERLNSITSTDTEE
jgi:hypothetical protein